MLNSPDFTRLHNHMVAVQLDGISTTRHTSSAGILNQYFSSVFTKVDNLQPPPDMRPGPYPEMSNIEINCKSIAHLLNELDPSKSHGPDDIPARLLKLLAVVILNYSSLLPFTKASYLKSGNRLL